MFSGLLRRFAGCCSLALLASGLAAAEPLWVDDTTRALDPAQTAALQRDLQAFSEETGLRLHVKAIPYVDPGMTMRAATRLARREFGRQGPVALILVERGRNGLGISHSPELWQRYPLARMIETLRSTLAKASASPAGSIDAKLLSATGQWMAEIRRLEQERRNAARLLQEPERPVLWTFLALLGAGGLATLLLTARSRTRAAANTQRYEFPEMLVGQRLGAPYGGGHIATCHDGAAPN